MKIDLTLLFATTASTSLSNFWLFTSFFIFLLSLNSATSLDLFCSHYWNFILELWRIFFEVDQYLIAFLVIILHSMIKFTQLISLISWFNFIFAKSHQNTVSSVTISFYSEIGTNLIITTILYSPLHMLAFWLII